MDCVHHAAISRAYEQHWRQVQAKLPQNWCTAVAQPVSGKTSRVPRGVNIVTQATNSL